MPDPFASDERWLSRDEFSVRREIVPQTTPRGSPPPKAKFLPSIFEDAHPWPLQWGGKEITEGRFFAHKDFNAGVQKRMENAGVRLAETAKQQGVRIRCTVAVTRYKERNLLERVLFLFEAGFEVSKGQWTFEPLGEITAVQDLTQEQRVALVEGTPMSPPGAAALEYKLKGKTVTIDPKRIAKVPTDDVFASLDRKLGDFITGLKRTTKEPKTPRGKQIEKAEKAAIREADKESLARTSATGRDPQLTGDKGTAARGVEGGKPLRTERATARPTPSPSTTTTTTPSGTNKPAATLQDRINAASRTQPTAEQVEALERALSNGETEVASTGGNRIRVTVKQVAKKGAGVAKGGIRAVAGLLPQIAGVIVQHEVDSYVSAGVERGIKWIQANYPNPEDVAPDHPTTRVNALAARKELEAKGSLWRAQAAPGAKYGIQARGDAIKSIEKNLHAVDQYNNYLVERLTKISAKHDQLYPVWDEVDRHQQAVYTLANELENKVELAAMLPGGYNFALELFS
jgi:hypothetical protein